MPPGGFVIAHRFGVGGFLHPNLDLVAGIDRQIAAGVQLGATGRDVVTGLQRQRPRLRSSLAFRLSLSSLLLQLPVRRLEEWLR